MATKQRQNGRWWLVILVLLLAACSFISPKTVGGMAKQSYYFDANLKFSVSYPETWKRVSAATAADSETVAWAPKEHGLALGAPGVLFRVVSRPPAHWKDDAAAIRADFAAAHAEAVLDKNQLETLPAGPAHSFLAHSPKRTFLVYLVTTSERDYLLEFSAKTKAFEGLVPLFRDIAATFRPLR
jgi:hypothetical protein